MAEKLKRIKILTSGPIPSRGNIYGPVLTPFYEPVSSIFKFVASGIDVVEVLSDGSEVKLTVSNYKNDNEAAIVNNNGEETKNPVDEESENVQDETPVNETEDAETEENENAEVINPEENETENENTVDDESENAQDETPVEKTETTETVERTKVQGKDNNNYVKHNKKNNNRNKH